MMHIIVNGYGEKVPQGMTIAALMEAMNERDAHIIVELNRKAVFPQRYGDTILRDGDVLELINPDFGG